MDFSNPLAPIFAASVAVQQILEVLSVFVEKQFGESRKKSVLGIIGFLVGILLANVLDLDVMAYFNRNSNILGIDTVVTALVLSAGTEGTNSIVKFLKYLKEDKKTTAAETLQTLRKRAGAAAPAAPSSGATRTLERLRSRAGRPAARPSATEPAAADASKSAALTEISEK